MTHTYQVTGMTCANCEATVKSNLLIVPDVTDVVVSKQNSSATVTMDKHVSLQELQEALGGKNSKYHIASMHHNEITEQAKGWLETYKPLLLIFAFITGIAFIVSWNGSNIHIVSFMDYFMAGFFITFSFFKLLNLKGFAESYAMYDVLARRVKGYGLIYPFIELALGLAYLTRYNPDITNVVTIIVMGFSSIGVIQSVVNKKKIQCACLGSVFNLPMSTITIIEDLLMVAMAAFMLIIYS